MGNKDPYSCLVRGCQEVIGVGIVLCWDHWHKVPRLLRWTICTILENGEGRNDPDFDGLTADAAKAAHKAGWKVRWRH